MNQIKQLAEWFRAAETAVAFTGAGISTESGIPDFRSPGGVWSRNQPVMYDEFVSSRAARIRYWKMRQEAYPDFKRAMPNAGHISLARLEIAGSLRGVITQNIDGLHQMAGSRQVIELHGTTRIVACISCGKEWEPDEIHAQIDAGDEAPDCDHCGSPLKSKTISFGQAMPAMEMERSYQWASESDLLIALGSSLVVEPAASIPRVAKRHGARLVIVNKTSTPLDDMADLVIADGIGDTMERLMAELKI